MQKYEDIPAIRRSDLWLLNQTPAVFKYKTEHPAEQTKSLLFGIAAHKYILEQFAFFDEYEIAPSVDRRTKSGKEEWAAYQNRLHEEGKSHIDIQDFTTIEEMAAAIDQNPLARQLLTGRTESVWVWPDPDTGEMCKCKCDCITHYEGKPIIVDYKTTESVQDGAFERSARKYGYKFQAGMYCEGLFVNTLTEYGFAFVAQEKNPPYAVRVYFCDKEFIQEGYDKFRELLGIYHDCKVRDEWPGYEPVELLADERE